MMIVIENGLKNKFAADKADVFTRLLKTFLYYYTTFYK